MFAASSSRTNAGIEARRRAAALRKQLSHIKDHAEDGGPITASASNRIIAEVAELHDVSVQDIKGPSRLRKIAAARQHAMYEVRRRGGSGSTTVIGRIFGGRDHTTVMHALRAWPVKAAEIGFLCVPLPGARAPDPMSAPRPVCSVSVTMPPGLPLVDCIGIYALLKDGKTIMETARRMGCSICFVRRVMKELRA